MLLVLLLLLTQWVRLHRRGQPPWCCLVPCGPGPCMKQVGELVRVKSRLVPCCIVCGKAHRCYRGSVGGAKVPCFMPHRLCLVVDVVVCGFVQGLWRPCLSWLLSGAGRAVLCHRTAPTGCGSPRITGVCVSVRVWRARDNQEVWREGRKRHRATQPPVGFRVYAHPKPSYPTHATGTGLLQMRVCCAAGSGHWRTCCSCCWRSRLLSCRPGSSQSTHWLSTCPQRPAGLLVDTAVTAAVLSQAAPHQTSPSIPTCVPVRERVRGRHAIPLTCMTQV